MEDLTGMNLQQAQAYVLEIIKALQTVRKQRREKEETRNLWQRRLALAQENQRPDLASAAREQLHPAETELMELQQEEDSLTSRVEQLQKKLRHLKEAPQLQTDAARLAAQMEELTGTSAEETQLNQDLRDAQLDSQLEALKKELGKDKN